MSRDESDVEGYPDAPLSGLLQEVYSSLTGGRNRSQARSGSTTASTHPSVSTPSSGTTTTTGTTASSGRPGASFGVQMSGSLGAGGPAGQMFSFTIPMAASMGAAGFNSDAIALETILQQLLSNVGGPGGLPVDVNLPFPFLQVLHGNPGDYAWGSQGLDTVITQLLNNLDASGPPPMPAEDIEKLPTVEVTETETSKNLQCTVCMEDFALKESVRQLPCGHLYHNDCIVPWLEMHRTCPICRKLFEVKEGSDTQSTPSSSQSRSNPSSSTPGGRYHDINEYD